MLDPGVSVLFSRDLDSVVTAREAEAVKEFLKDSEEAKIHAMRDHPNHNIGMLAGKLYYYV